MSLPRFKDLEIYSTTNTKSGNHGGDLPQRFYMTLEQEELADWKIKVGDVILPVHSQPLCLACGVYCGMATGGGIVQDGPIPLEGCSLADALAFLRLVYRVQFIDSELLAFLLISGHLPGVLRLAHKLDWAHLETLTTLAAKALESDGSSFEAHIQELYDAASDLNLKTLEKACRQAVFMLCKAKTYNFSECAMARGVFEITKLLEGSPQLLKEALFIMATHKSLGDRPFKESRDEFFLSSSVFTWTVPSSAFNSNERLDSDWFKWNDDLEFRLKFFPKGNNRPSQCSLYIEQKEPPEVRGPPVAFTLLMEKWCNPAMSIRKVARHAFTQEQYDWGFTAFATIDEMMNCLDPQGNLILHAAEMSIPNE